MAYQIVLWKYCNSSEVVRYGTQNGRSRFHCKDCGRIFKTDYVYRAYEPGVKDQIVDIAMNGGGIRDTARILGIGKSTVISELKKSPPKWSPLTLTSVRVRSPLKSDIYLILLWMSRRMSNGATLAIKRISVGFGTPLMPWQDVFCRSFLGDAKMRHASYWSQIWRHSTSEPITQTTGAAILHSSLKISTLLARNILKK